MARERSEVDSSTPNKVEPSGRNNQSTGETSASTGIPETRTAAGKRSPPTPAGWTATVRYSRSRRTGKTRTEVDGPSTPDSYSTTIPP